MKIEKSFISFLSKYIFFPEIPYYFLFSLKHILELMVQHPPSTMTVMIKCLLFWDIFLICPHWVFFFFYQCLFLIHLFPFTDSCFVNNHVFSLGSLSSSSIIVRVYPKNFFYIDTIYIWHQHLTNNWNFFFSSWIVFFLSGKEIFLLTLKLEPSLNFIQMCQFYETIQRCSLSLREQKNFVMLFECYLKLDHCLRILFNMSIWFIMFCSPFSFDLSHIWKTWNLYLFYILYHLNDCLCIH